MTLPKMEALTNGVNDHVAKSKHSKQYIVFRMPYFYDIYVVFRSNNSQCNSNLLEKQHYTNCLIIESGIGNAFGNSTYIPWPLPRRKSWIIIGILCLHYISIITHNAILLGLSGPSQNLFLNYYH